MRQISKSPLSLVRQIFLKLAVSTTHNSAIRPFCRPHGCVLSVDSGSLVYLPPELPPCMAGWSRWLARRRPPPWSAAGATAAAAAASSPARAPSASESASESSLLSSGGSRTPFTSPWASARHTLSVTYERPVRYIRETPENETKRDDERHLHPLSVPQNSFSTVYRLLESSFGIQFVGPELVHLEHAIQVRCLSRGWGMR